MKKTFRYHHHEPYCDGTSTQPNACPGHRANKTVLTVAKVLAYEDCFTYEGKFTRWENLTDSTQQDYVDAAAVALNALHLNQ